LTRKVAILQSNYIPWKGYFDIMRRVDEFILFDDVQYTRRDWRNRNRIKTAQGPQWLTIPVNTKGRYLDPIRDITVSEPGWNTKHWETLANHYARARCFKDYRAVFEDAYRSAVDERLSAVNRRLIEAVQGVLGITTKLSWSMDYQVVEGRTERLVSLCRQAGATEYLSGPAARAYLDEGQFERSGIALRYMSYQGYPEYAQLHPPFVHEVTVLDLIFNEGPRARDFLLSA
jgi:hypothetical protein